MDQINLSSLITPAIAISALAYLTRFFGKIIDDQSSFSDDKKWAIELRGVLFMLDAIPFGFLGIKLALYKPWGVNSWWMPLITFSAVGVITVVLLLSNKYLGSKFFNIWKQDIQKLEQKTSGFIKIFAKASKYISVGIVSLILFYFGTLEWFSKSTYLMALLYPATFFVFIVLAQNFSLKKSLQNKIVPVDIYFTDPNKEPLKKVVVLKYNPDNIRIRSENKVIILNRNEFSKIEMVIPKETL